MFTKLKNFILMKLGISELRHQLAMVEKKVEDRFNFLGAYMNLIQEEEVIIDKVVAERAAARLKSQFGIGEINMATHKNDVMLAMHIFGHGNNVEEAVFTHFKIGLEITKNLKEVCNEFGFYPQSILDFGSGYGRVSRFLPWQFPEANIQVSEVKGRALDFQKKHFGFQGIYHDQQPDSLTMTPQDLILAVSVFTHLPKQAFEGWFQKLTSSLSEKGAMVFTFNNADAKQYQQVAGGVDFLYQKKSEDSRFAFLSDSLNNTNEYGLTFVSYNYLQSLCERAGVKISFLSNRITKAQEVAIVQRAEL